MIPLSRQTFISQQTPHFKLTSRQLVFYSGRSCLQEILLAKVTLLFCLYKCIDMCISVYEQPMNFCLNFAYPTTKFVLNFYKFHGKAETLQSSQFNYVNFYKVLTFAFYFFRINKASAAKMKIAYENVRYSRVEHCEDCHFCCCYKIAPTEFWNLDVRGIVDNLESF